MQNLHQCKDEKSFKDLLNAAGSQIIVLHFEADWAPECKQMNEVFAELAKEYIHTVFIRVEAEEVADVTRYHEVESVPTFVILKEQKVVDKIEGASAAELTKRVKHHVTSFVVPVIKANNTEQTLEDRLKGLINGSACMLFMKGSPDTPKCGFSRQTIELLNQHSIKFSYFDILTDNEVRQGLKKYSDWPTYPQLYADGELVGGLDIIKELAENGELADMLPKAEDINTRLSELVKRSPVMIFMKGNPENPRCKFSKALMAIMKNTSVKFDSFDILEDEEVRQGLKTFSDWPTYPQIYVHGEFVGGVDIIKALEESGELNSTLSPS